MFHFLYGWFGYSGEDARYVITVLLGYPLGFFLYHVLSPKYVSLSTRHTFSAITGLFLGYVCLGGW
jgi:hypothetical protein